eukprot:CAMPEP_0170116504 /NCGR_PEP_ID=MMETSP0020_2-20130122/12315_1 /TAXON_ID=98059 /ORGANISM="Dinobryon sp., Strain UTEXLB2267" /LENGTH=1689 /DNA_ID=CAMNT_0010344647 /DNA_START=153 /DNA_END=5217 /DNA_ORIENTATION=+
MVRKSQSSKLDRSNYLSRSADANNICGKLADGNNLVPEYLNRFDINTLFAAAVKIIAMKEPLLSYHNCDAIRQLTQNGHVVEPRNFQGQVAANIKPPVLQVLGGLCSACEIIVSNDKSAGEVISEFLAEKLLLSIPPRSADMWSTFSYLMGNYNEYFPYGREFAEKNVGSTTLGVVNEVEWISITNAVSVTIGNRDSEDDVTASNPFPQSEIRESAAKVTLHRVDASMEYKPKVIAVKSTTSKPMSHENTLDDQFHRDSVNRYHTEDSATHKGDHYNDTGIFRQRTFVDRNNSEQITNFDDDSDQSDQKVRRHVKQEPVKQKAKDSREIHRAKDDRALKSNYNYDDDIEEMDAIEDIDVIEDSSVSSTARKQDTKVQNVTKESKQHWEGNGAKNTGGSRHDKARDRPPDDSILSIPELEEEIEQVDRRVIKDDRLDLVERGSVNSWDDEEEESKPHRQSLGTNANVVDNKAAPSQPPRNDRRMTENLYAFDESDSDHSVVPVKRNSFHSSSATAGNSDDRKASSSAVTHDPLPHGTLTAAAYKEGGMVVINRHLSTDEGGGAHSVERFAQSEFTGWKQQAEKKSKAKQSWSQVFEENSVSNDKEKEKGGRNVVRFQDEVELSHSDSKGISSSGENIVEPPAVLNDNEGTTVMRNITDKPEEVTNQKNTNINRKEDANIAEVDISVGKERASSDSFSAFDVNSNASDDSTAKKTKKKKRFSGLSSAFGFMSKLVKGNSNKADTSNHNDIVETVHDSPSVITTNENLHNEKHVEIINTLPPEKISHDNKNNANEIPVKNNAVKMIPSDVQLNTNEKFVQKNAINTSSSEVPSIQHEKPLQKNAVNIKHDLENEKQAKSTPVLNAVSTSVPQSNVPIISKSIDMPKPTVVTSKEPPTTVSNTSEDQRVLTDKTLITTLVHDETEESIMELFNHVDRRDSSASISSMSSIDSRNSRTSRLSIASFIGLGGPTGEAQPDSANKQGDKLSNPALKSRSSFSIVKKLFRFSLTKGNNNTGNGKESEVDIVDDNKPDNDETCSPQMDLRASNRLSAAHIGVANNSKSVPYPTDENLRVSRSSAVRSSSNIIRDGLPAATNGVGLAKRLRHGLQKPTNLQIQSMELPSTLSTPPLSSLQILHKQLAEIESVAERHTEVMTMAATLEKFPAPSATNRKDALRKDLIAIQKNRGNRTIKGPLPPKVFEVGGDIDVAEVQRKFRDLKSKQLKTSLLSDREFMERKEFVAALKRDSEQKKRNSNRLDFLHDHQSATMSFPEPLFAALAMNTPLPPHVAEAKCSLRSMSLLAQSFNNTNDNSSAFQCSSEWDLAVGVHFSGLLSKRLPRGGFKTRYFVLQLRLLDNPNVVKKQMDDHVAAMLASPTVKNYKDAMYDCDKMKNQNQYFLMEYSSVTQSKWGQVPIGFKRSYDLSQLISIQTKTAANSTGLTFKLIFQSQPSVSQTSTSESKPSSTPAVDSGPVLSSPSIPAAAGGPIAIRPSVQQAPAKPLEQLHLMSYMNILQKNVPNSLTAKVEEPAAAKSPSEQPDVQSREEVQQDGPSTPQEVASLVEDDQSMDSFDQDMQQEFADINGAESNFEDEYYDDEDMMGSQGSDYHNNNDYHEENMAYENHIGEEEQRQRLHAEKQQEMAAMNAKREIYKILSQPINRKGNKKMFPVLCLRAIEPDERLKWVAALQAAAKSEV